MSVLLQQLRHEPHELARLGREHHALVLARGGGIRGGGIRGGGIRGGSIRGGGGGG
jgi:hypothetical protein